MAAATGSKQEGEASVSGGRVHAYLGVLALAAAGLALWLLTNGYGPPSLWPLLLLTVLAAVAERGTVPLSAHLEASVSFVPMLLAAVALGPVASMLAGGVSMLGELGHPSSQASGRADQLRRWGVISLSRSLTGGLSGLVAWVIVDALGRDFGGIVAATAAAAIAAQALDAAFCVLTLVLRRTGGIGDVLPVLPTLAVSAALYAPLVAALVLAYERISPWTLVLFLVPALAAQRLLALYQRERRLLKEVAAANAHLRRRDAILVAVSTAAQRFLEASSFGDAVGAMLAELGEAAEADHVCVLEARGEQAAVSVRYAWSHTEAGDPPPAQVAVAGASAAIFAGQESWGLIGFPTRRDGREWSTAEVEGLRAAAGILGAAIERRRAEAELRSRDEQLRQSQKMEAIGRLAGGIAHDFNNLLTAIGGYSDLLVTALDPNDPRRADALEIHKAAERAGALTGQLLAFSRKQVVAPEILDLNAVIEDADALLRRVIGEQVQLSLQLDTRIAGVLADPGHLQQIVLNLALNARDAMPDGGELLLRTANVIGNSSKQRSSVLLEVADTGQGMDEATRARIFEPFFTTKDVGKGTGLGLATVHGIVEQSGGRIEVESEPGRGTVFRIYFPAAVEVATPVEDPPAREAPGGSETILLVEDEPTVRDLTARVLRAAGYRVLEAADAAAALALSDAHEGVIELLLTDVVMPRTSGRELAEQITSRRLFTKALFMSGYTANTALDSVLTRLGAGFLPKPFTPDDLLRAVREALDSRVQPQPAVSGHAEADRRPYAGG